MGVSLKNKLVIAISSRALFDLTDSHRVYEEKGLAAYSAYQVEREDEPLAPGEAFPLVQKMLRINERLPGDDNARGLSPAVPKPRVRVAEKSREDHRNAAKNQIICQ